MKVTYIGENENMICRDVSFPRNVSVDLAANPDLYNKLLSWPDFVFHEADFDPDDFFKDIGKVEESWEDFPVKPKRTRRTKAQMLGAKS